MASSSTTERLNDLLVELHRSGAQYVAQAWPWSRAKDQSLRSVVQSLAERQNTDVGKLVEFLSARRHRIDFGLFPLEYGNLHYVDLEYLYNVLADNQSRIVRQLEAAETSVPGNDADAAALLIELTHSQRRGLEELQAARPVSESASA